MCALYLKKTKRCPNIFFKNYRARGINVILNQDTVEIRQEDGLKVVVTKDRSTGEITETKVEEILVAAGIRPAVEELHLENTGIETWPKGWIKTNEFLETSVDGIYALGDVNGEPAFPSSCELRSGYHCT